MDTARTSWLPGRPSASGGAGLVLLYAPNHEAIPNARDIPPGGIIIGRDPPADGLVIPQGAVSRNHARISLELEGWTLADLGSRNGVVVNGRLVQRTRLANGDVVHIGEAIFKFVDAGMDDYADHTVAGAASPERTAAQLGMVGGPVVRQIAAQVKRVAKAGLSVLVVGETGSGKELVARGIHEASGRSGRFCALNCAAIPDNLVESELFGYRKGAFTGADRDRIGIVRAAEGGTLLLDEIGDMPLDAQAKLLRLLETREIVPIGGVTAEPVDVRVICATHWNLPDLVARGRFRGDLFARINGYTLKVPPLRARKEDIYSLMKLFLTEAGYPQASMSFGFMLAALRYDWPYNVRELKNAVHRAIALTSVTASGFTLDVDHLPETILEIMHGYGSAGSENPSTFLSTRSQMASIPPSEESVPSVGVPSAPGSGVPSVRSGRAPSQDELAGLLRTHQGNVAAVARELGKDRTQIHRWLKAYGLSPDAFRS